MRRRHCSRLQPRPTYAVTEEHWGHILYYRCQITSRIWQLRHEMSRLVPILMGENHVCPIGTAPLNRILNCFHAAQGWSSGRGKA